MGPVLARLALTRGGRGISTGGGGKIRNVLKGIQNDFLKKGKSADKPKDGGGGKIRNVLKGIQNDFLKKGKSADKPKDGGGGKIRNVLKGIQNDFLKKGKSADKPKDGGGGSMKKTNGSISNHKQQHTNGPQKNAVANANASTNTSAKVSLVSAKHKHTGPPQECPKCHNCASHTQTQKASHYAQYTHPGTNTVVSHYQPQVQISGPTFNNSRPRMASSRSVDLNEHASDDSVGSFPAQTNYEAPIGENIPAAQGPGPAAEPRMLFLQHEFFPRLEIRHMPHPAVWQRDVPRLIQSMGGVKPRLPTWQVKMKADKHMGEVMAAMFARKAQLRKERAKHKLFTF